MGYSIQASTPSHPDIIKLSLHSGKLWAVNIYSWKLHTRSDPAYQSFGHGDTFEEALDHAVSNLGKVWPPRVTYDLPKRDRDYLQKKRVATIEELF